METKEQIFLGLIGYIFAEDYLVEVSIDSFPNSFIISNSYSECVMNYNNKNGWTALSYTKIINL